MYNYTGIGILLLALFMSAFMGIFQASWTHSNFAAFDVCVCVCVCVCAGKDLHCTW